MTDDRYKTRSGYSEYRTVKARSSRTGANGCVRVHALRAEKALGAEAGGEGRVN